MNTETTRTDGSRTPFLLGLAAVAVLSVLVPPLAVPGVVVTLILGLSFPTSGGRIHRSGQVGLAVAVVGCLVGLGRFALSKAMLGIVEGGQSAAAHSALWRVREVVIAEDALRRNAAWDPDGDHVGSAALVSALAGKSGLRNGSPPLSPPLLNYAFREQVQTRIGPAMRVEGYLVIVCLPAQGGGFTARPGDAIDDERAERRYVVYAWPTELAEGMKTVFFTDEHEHILFYDPPASAKAPYLGPDRPPACDAAPSGDSLPWVVWKNKKPREKLPGE